MKNYLSFWFIPLIILLTGCSTRVSTHHRHHNHEYRHHNHNHVSVGVHGRASGAGVLGALIVGGIIGSIIHDQQHQHDEDLEPQTDAEELENGYALDEEPVDHDKQVANTIESPNDIADKEFQQAKQQQSKNVEWHQVGKDGKCYLMRVSNGVTDVVAAVPDTNCQQ